jgi:putative MATE family efflux protein
MWFGFKPQPGILYLDRHTDSLARSDGGAACAPATGKRGESIDVFTRYGRSLTRTTLLLAGPAVAENLLQTLLLIVDMLMVAYYGSVPIAAAAAAGMLLWRLDMTLGCIERGTTALVARRWGEGSREGAALACGQALVLAVVVGTVLTAGGVAFAPQLLRLIRTPAEPLATAIPYMRVVLLASIANMILFVGAACMRAMGDTRTPMWVALAMNGSNITFNYLLIYGKCGLPELRLLGSGISTTISLLLGAGAVAAYLVRAPQGPRVRWRHLRPHRATLATIIRVSLPAFAEELMITGGSLVFFSFVARLGTLPLAAHALSGRLESLSYMAGGGFATAAATLVGQALGRHDVNLGRLAFRRTTQLSVAVMSSVAAGLVIFGRPLLRLFCREADVVELAYALLMVAAVEQPLMAIAMTVSGGLRGAGDTRSPMFSSLFGNLIVRIVATYVLAFPVGLGIYGVALGTIVDWMVRCTILFFGYRSGRWTRIAL